MNVESRAPNIAKPVFSVGCLVRALVAPGLTAATVLPVVVGVEVTFVACVELPYIYTAKIQRSNATIINPNPNLVFCDPVRNQFLKPVGLFGGILNGGGDGG